MTWCFLGRKGDTAEMVEDGTDMETEAPHTIDSKLHVSVFSEWGRK